jgi:hypothetical protein
MYPCCLDSTPSITFPYPVTSPVHILKLTPPAQYKIYTEEYTNEFKQLLFNIYFSRPATHSDMLCSNLLYFNLMYSLYYLLAIPFHFSAIFISQGMLLRFQSKQPLNFSAFTKSKFLSCSCPSPIYIRKLCLMAFFSLQ